MEVRFWVISALE